MTTDNLRGAGQGKPSEPPEQGKSKTGSPAPSDNNDQRTERDDLSELGKGSEINAVPPDATRDPLPPDSKPLGSKPPT